MTEPHPRDNLKLAERARMVADRAPAGSLRKAAAGSVAVTCATTRDIEHARDVLEGVTPERVRKAAIELLDHLTAGEPRAASNGTSCTAAE